MYLHFADLASTTYDNSDQWPDRWHQQLPRQWSRHLYRVALITVTRYYTASARTWCDASSQFKIPPHVFSLEPDTKITSRRCYVTCTGFRSGGGSTSSWHALFTCHWLDKLLITSPRIFTSLLQVQVASSVSLRTGRAVSHARTARPATEALLQQGLVCGTVCHRICATKNSVFGASGGCWKLTGLLLTTAQCERLFIAL